MNAKVLTTALAASLLLTGCYTPATNYVQADSEKLTLGKAQMVLREGMTQSEVVSNLGAPNMVTRDADGIETWVYDKSSTEVISTSNSAGASIILASVKGSQGASQTTQRTLTLILKFRDGRLSKFTYNSTSF